MKTLLLIAALLLSAAPCFSQVEVTASELPNYQGVVTVAGVSADEAYSRVKAWVATAYASAQDVIQLDDAQNRRLVVRGNQVIASRVLGMNVPMRVHNTLTIEMRDGRFRYTILVTDITSDQEPNNSQLDAYLRINNRQTAGFKERVGEAFAGNIESLYHAVLSDSIVGGDDW